MNQWTEDKEQQLYEWAFQSEKQSAGHSLAHEYYIRQFSIITSIITLLSVLSAILEGVNLSYEVPIKGVSIAVIALSAISGGVSQYLTNKNPSQLAYNHQELSKGYNRLVLKIESELANSEEERKPGVQFVHEVSETLQGLSTGTCSIPERIWKKTKPYRTLESVPAPEPVGEPIPGVHYIEEEDTKENKRRSSEEAAQLHTPPDSSFELRASNRHAKKMSFELSRFGY